MVIWHWCGGSGRDDDDDLADVEGQMTLDLDPELLLEVQDDPHRPLPPASPRRPAD